LCGELPTTKGKDNMDNIATLASIKRALRDKYAWPGGYPLYIVMADGEALSIDAARAEWRNICHSTLHGFRDGWQAAGVDVNWEDTDLTCAHTGAAIESAYGEG
jgi:hypothetical protein